MRDIREIVGVIPSDLWSVAENLLGEEEVSGAVLMNGWVSRWIGGDTFGEGAGKEGIARTEGAKCL